MQAEQIERFVALALEVGLALQPGQKVVLRAEAVHHELVGQLAEAAYRRGAAAVHWECLAPELTRSAVLWAPDAELATFPAFWQSYWQEISDGSWSVLTLDSAAVPQLLDDLPSERLARRLQGWARHRAQYIEALMSSRFCWSVSAWPTLGWAQQIFGPAEASTDRLDGVLASILKLDQADPVQAWRAHNQELDQRAQHLTDAQYQALHFQAPGTDLVVGLMPQSIWRGGSEGTPTGQRFAPNLPTEEVFTTPDWRTTRGRVRATRPVEFQGVLVEGIELVFDQGRVVEFSAQRGQAALAQYLVSDAQANALGEIALVDSTGPIFQSGLVFRNILLDENAACHLALGSGYPDAVRGGRSLTEAQRLALGCNVSVVHTDVMFGCPELRVSGRTANGQEHVLMADGKFCAPL